MTVASKKQDLCPCPNCKRLPNQLVVTDEFNRAVISCACGLKYQTETIPESYVHIFGEIYRRLPEVPALTRAKEIWNNLCTKDDSGK